MGWTISTVHLYCGSVCHVLGPSQGVVCHVLGPSQDVVCHVLGPSQGHVTIAGCCHLSILCVCIVGVYYVTRMLAVGRFGGIIQQVYGLCWHY